MAVGTWLGRGIHGYLEILLTGFGLERFLNLCSANSIEIWGVRHTSQGCRFYMTVKGFRLSGPLARKAKVRLRILQRLGLPFFLYRNRRRKLFFIGFAMFFAILYTLSLFIWDIDFEGNHQYTYDTLVKFLETQQIHYGMWKSQVDCEKAEEALRTEFTEITWVSARVSGTRLLVKIKENEVLSSIPARDDSPCDIVAKKPGTITSMIVRQGIPMVAVGDQVEAGQVLVSGSIPITDDSESVVNTHYVHADGDIQARTAYAYHKSFPNLHQVAAKTGRVRKGVYLKAFRFSMMLMVPRPKDTSWDVVTEQRQMKLFQNFYLPFYAGVITGREFVVYERMYTKQELEQIADSLDENFKKKLLEKGVQILENNVKILRDQDQCHVAGHLTVEEEIGRNQTIEEPEETSKIDEHSGNHY